MESITSDINIVSAKCLQVNSPSYVVVSLVENAQNEQETQTKVDYEGGKNPNWNFIMNFIINGSAARQDLNTHLYFTLRNEREFGDKSIFGEVEVPVVELLNSAGDGKSMQPISFPIKTPSGQTEGRLNFEYKFIVNVSLSPPPPPRENGFATREIGYPPPQPHGYYPPAPGYGGYMYPPPSPSYYPHPPTHYNMYPPAAVGFYQPINGQRSVPNSEKKKSKSKWGKCGKILGGMMGAAAFGALTGGSSLDFGSGSVLDPSVFVGSYAAPDFSSIISNANFSNAIG